MSLAERSAVALLSSSEEALRSVGLEKYSGFAVEDLWGGEEVDGMVKFGRCAGELESSSPCVKEEQKRNSTQRAIVSVSLMSV